MNYYSLGTFEFLFNPQTSEYFFLEINPRLQVEHTITESICSIDIVKTQLRLAQGATFEEARLGDISQDSTTPPKAYSIQLRITAENPEKDYSLSIGKINSFRFPSGNGIRVDTALVSGAPAVVTSDFDSVIAKLIITSRTWQDVVAKAQRALEDTSITGITTNLTLLRAIVCSQDFVDGACDTQWLESHHKQLLEQSKAFASSSKDPLHGLAPTDSATTSAPGLAGASTMFRKDDAWSISLQPLGTSEERKHHLEITKVLKNDFPSSFAAELAYTIRGSEVMSLKMEMESTKASGK